jgi:hypothetical protein
MGAGAGGFHQANRLAIKMARAEAISEPSYRLCIQTLRAVRRKKLNLSSSPLSE